MELNGRGAIQEATVVDKLLDPSRAADADWLAKLEIVEKVKALRQQRQASRKGKPITLTGRWGPAG